MGNPITINGDEFIEVALRNVKAKFRAELERSAQQIIEEEVARYALELSQFIRITSRDTEIVITIRKEVSDVQVHP